MMLVIEMSFLGVYMQGIANEDLLLLVGETRAGKRALAHASVKKNER